MPPPLPSPLALPTVHPCACSLLLMVRLPAERRLAEIAISRQLRVEIGQARREIEVELRDVFRRRGLQLDRHAHAVGAAVGDGYVRSVVAHLVTELAGESHEAGGVLRRGGWQRVSGARARSSAPRGEVGGCGKKGRGRVGVGWRY